MPKRFDEPNYTQSPNAFYDEVLREIDTLAELKVTDAIIRHTFGFHRDAARLSFTYLETFTGLSRESVSEGLKAALTRGTVQRVESGASFEYSLVLGEPSDKGAEVVKRSDQPEAVDQSSDPTSASQAIRPVLVKRSDQSIYKESIKEKLQKKTDKEIIADGASASADAKPKRQLSDWQQGVKEMSEAIASVTGDDLKVDQTKRRVSQVAAQLLKAGYIPTDVLPFWDWWKANDWRGKDGQRPTKELVLSELPRSKNIGGNGHGKASPDKDAPVNDATVAHVKEMQEGGFKYG